MDEDPVEEVVDQVEDHSPDDVAAEDQVHNPRPLLSDLKLPPLTQVETPAEAVEEEDAISGEELYDDDDEEEIPDIPDSEEEEEAAQVDVAAEAQRKYVQPGGIVSVFKNAVSLYKRASLF